MDKVKQYLALVRKHHFWILCGIAALVGLLAWYTSAKKLTAQFKQRSDEINGYLSKLQAIRSPHPNETWTSGIKKTTDATRQDVKEAWQKLYQFQKEKIFIWPERLGKDFLDAIGSDRLARDLRVRYQNMVKRTEDGEVARLAEIVNAPPAGETMITRVSQGEEQQMNPVDLSPGYRVSWPGLSDLANWYDWYAPPTTQDVKFAQEELWVLQGLCNVIKAVNAGSTGAHDAPVKVIDEMAIAYPAADDPATSTTGRIQPVKASAVTGTATGGSETPPGMGGPSEGGSGARPDPKTRLKGAGAGYGGGIDSGGGGAGPVDPDEHWRNYRYVNVEGKPLMAADLANGPAEYNLMPFRLALQMDPREVDRLLVECRNSLLPIEVRQVRINPGAERSGGGMTGGGYAGTRQQPYIAPAGATGQEGRQSRLARVEISGVIYLLRSPDIQSLGIAPETAAPPADGAAPPADGAVPAGSAAIAAPHQAVALAPGGSNRTIQEGKP